MTPSCTSPTHGAPTGRAAELSDSVVVVAARCQRSPVDENGSSVGHGALNTISTAPWSSTITARIRRSRSLSWLAAARIAMSTRSSRSSAPIVRSARSVASDRGVGVGTRARGPAVRRRRRRCTPTSVSTPTDSIAACSRPNIRRPSITAVILPRSPTAGGEAITAGGGGSVAVAGASGAVGTANVGGGAGGAIRSTVIHVGCSGPAEEPPRVRRRPVARRAVARSRRGNGGRIRGRKLEPPSGHDQVGLDEHRAIAHVLAPVELPDLGPSSRCTHLLAGDRPQRLAPFDNVHVGGPGSRAGAPSPLVRRCRPGAPGPSPARCTQRS